MEATISVIELLIDKYGGNATLNEVLNKIDNKKNTLDNNCINCKNKICKGWNTGRLAVGFKCIKSGNRFVKRFEDWDKCHEWHHLYWNEVVMNG